jgi:cytochrome P450
MADQKPHQPGAPPGPLNMLGASGLTWRHAFEMVFRPIRFFSRLSVRYGDLSFFHLFGHRAYFVNHPDLISEILIHQADAFTKLPRQIKVIQQIFGKSILITEGDRWKQDRQHMQRAFGSRLREQNLRVTLAATQRMLKRWDGLPEVSMIHEMTQLTAEIAIELCISGAEPGIAARLSEAVIFMSDEFAHEMNSIVRLPGFIPSRRRKRKAVALQAYFELFDRAIQQRRSASGPPPDDILQYLLDTPSPAGTSPLFIRDQLLTMLIAAYHASSMALVWIFLLLDQHPEIGQRLLDDPAALDSGATARDLSSLEYLECVVKEALRLYPPAWALFARESVRDIDLGGYRIPAGGWFYISPLITQRRECLFPDALTFRPERFLPENRKAIPKNGWFPFGLGGHSCIGSSLAMDQLQLIVGTVLEQVLLRRDEKKMPDVSALLVLRPVGEVRMRLEASPIAGMAFEPGRTQMHKQDGPEPAQVNGSLEPNIARAMDLRPVSQDGSVTGIG